MIGFRAEPTAVVSAIRLCIHAAIAFGLDWTPEQVVTLMAAVEAVLMVFLRQQVTSDRTLDRSGLMREGAYIAEKPLISLKEWDTRAGKDG